jgi:hypothetical protein
VQVEAFMVLSYSGGEEKKILSYLGR